MGVLRAGVIAVITLLGVAATPPSASAETKIIRTHVSVTSAASDLSLNGLIESKNRRCTRGRKVHLQLSSLVEKVLSEPGDKGEGVYAFSNRWFTDVAAEE